ncbi:MAG: hypothetical protein PHX80_05535 [Candidatus Nanoarchaeia archaeon]|nr:hypothetical protein [Candidatus Nanoarchaeia archaeon]
MKKTKKKPVKKKKHCKAHLHKWRYYGGEAKCIVKGCNKYIQPDGRITTKP